MSEQAIVDLNDDPEGNRALARFMVELLTDSLRMSMTTAVEMARWLIASLLAVNGGAAIATWPVLNDPFYRVSACGLFVTGILAALLSAFLSVRSVGALSKIVGEPLGYWITVVQDGERVATLEAEHSQFDAKISKISRPAQIVGWASGLFFLVGVVIAGTGIVKSPGVRDGHGRSEKTAPVRGQPETKR